MEFIKKICISFIALIVLFSQLAISLGDISASANGDITLRLGLKDEVFTKSERVTFDVWARDASDSKIPDDNVVVTNNGEDVGINWSDEVKTSYTAWLTEGSNNIIVTVKHEGQELSKSVHITYEEAAIGDVIGEFTFSMDGFVVGMGYFIEPMKVPIINGDNGAYHLDRILYDHEFEYTNTGNLDTGFYLSSILGGNILDKGYPAKIPPAVIDATVERGEAEPDPENFYPEDYGIGEFDFNHMSGWMYSVNNVFPNVGFSDYYLMNEDIMRVQYTVAYGSDIGGGYAMGGNEHDQYFPHVNKDFLTEIAATINSSPFKAALYANTDLESHYKHVIDNVLPIVDISQEELDEAEANLRARYEAALPVAITKTIDTLPDDAMESERALMEIIRYQLDKLSSSQLEAITNLSKFEALENPVLEPSTPENVQEVIDQIDTLPTEIELTDAATIERVYALYEALAAEEQLLVTNAHQLLEKYRIYNDLKQANEVKEQILALPSVEAFQIEDEQELETTITSYEALTEDQKQYVTNASILEVLTEKLAELKEAHEKQVADREAAAEKQKEDRAVAQQVMGLIAALPIEELFELADEPKLLEAQEAYNALTEDQKAYVENVSVLNTITMRLAELKAVAEKEATDKAAAKKVSDVIALLPSEKDFDLNNESSLLSAQAAYDELTKEQQEYVVNKEILVELAKKLTQLKTAAEKEATDKAAAKAVIDLIAALPLEKDFSLADEPKLIAAQTAFDALTTEQQALVENAELLKPLQNKLEQLLFQKNNPAVYNVIVAIDSLPETATLADEINYNKVKAAYEALTKEQKALVTNASILSDFAKKLENVKAKDVEALIENVIYLIDQLPLVTEVTLQNETSISNVERTYNNLTKEQKLKVINYNKLSSLVSRIKEIKEDQEVEAAIKKVSEAIYSIPAIAQISLSNKAYIQSVRTQYNALTTEHKARVVGIDKLLQAEYKIQELEQVVTHLITEINTLPAVITDAQRTKVGYLLNTYNALTISQKLAVTNVNKLLDVEQQLKKLEETKVEAPQTTVPKDLQAAIKDSEGIVAVQKDEQSKVITLATDDKNTKAPVLSNELLTQIEKMDVEKVVLTAANNINFEIPKTILSKSLTKNASFEVDAKPSKAGLTPSVKVDFAEVLSNGIKRDINLTKQYVTVKLPLSLFNKETASTTVAKASNDGVILRKTEEGFEAVPHKIVNGEAIIFANANAEYVYSTDVITFDDIAQRSDKENIEFLASRYVVKGYSEENYGPNKSITRAQFAVMIARALNLIAEGDAVHTDTKGKTYEKAVQALYEAGITDVKGEFNPNGTLTRQHAASYMYRVLKYTNYDFKENQKEIHLKDLNKISSTHLPAVLALYELGIMSGKTDGNFDPNGKLTRAQMAKILKLTLTKSGMM